MIRPGIMVFYWKPLSDLRFEVVLFSANLSANLDGLSNDE